MIPLLLYIKSKIEEKTSDIGKDERKRRDDCGRLAIEREESNNGVVGILRVQ